MRLNYLTDLYTPRAGFWRLLRRFWTLLLAGLSRLGLTRSRRITIAMCGCPPYVVTSTLSHEKRASQRSGLPLAITKLLRHRGALSGCFCMTKTPRRNPKTQSTYSTRPPSTSCASGYKTHTNTCPGSSTTTAKSFSSSPTAHGSSLTPHRAMRLDSRTYHMISTWLNMLTGKTLSSAGYKSSARSRPRVVVGQADLWDRASFRSCDSPRCRQRSQAWSRRQRIRLRL